MNALLTGTVLQITSGGAKDAWPGAIHAWLNEARTYGWVPAALSPGREAAQAYVDLAAGTLHGRAVIVP